ncbi:aldo/keto reductase family protein [Syncephalastrum racemosum]|uniref:Aldo/keto reductase family protein n=1 Tax=Syncephalastrum racemosum TaxID=13706 RepID=A0A1X2HNY6_SYNRA|nr:aldo/keto reductase family protein [Syncephalastrum racemosum]
MTQEKQQILRQLGKDGPIVNALGLGAMGMSAFYTGRGNITENIRVLERAVERGCTFIDTADIYGKGENEKLLSHILKKRRDEIFLCTKFGFRLDCPEGVANIDGRPEYVQEACEASLKRLGVDTIDLYYQHRVDPNTPIEDTVKAMADLVKQGKVRYLGLSECSAQTLRRAYAVHPISAVQIEFSPWTLDIEQNGLLETARELGVAIVAYSPLGRGFLTGAIKTVDDLAADDSRRLHPRFLGDNFIKNLELVDKIKELAQRKGCTSSQLCLSWVLAQGEDFFVIPGTTKMKNLEENLAAAHVELSQEDMGEVRSIITSFEVSGQRYKPSYMELLNR